MEGILDIISTNGEAALDVLEWGLLGVGLTFGMTFALVAIGFALLLCFCSDWYLDRRAKKTGRFTAKQRLELLESKIDSLADIVISSSPEEK